MRFALRDVLLNLYSNQHKQQLRVAIYGAGEAGAQLSAALRLAGNHKIVTFFDDNPEYWSRSINGVVIQPPQVLMELEGSIDKFSLRFLLCHEPKGAASSTNYRNAAYLSCRCLLLMISPQDEPASMP